jgi:hypothetical protein
MPNRVEGKTVEELLDQLVGPEVGSAAHEQIKAAIQVRIAELQSEAARDSLAWAKLTALATAGATAIALVALLVAAL